MDQAQALTGADDAVNTGGPDQPASNATTRPGQAQTRSAPAPAGPGRGDGLAGHFTAGRQQWRPAGVSVVWSCR
jgi:hypothetical protein